jgi:hypothetical protein
VAEQLDAHEAAAVREDVEDAGARLGLGIVLGLVAGRAILAIAAVLAITALAAVAAIPAVVTTPAAAATSAAAAPRRALVGFGIVIAAAGLAAGRLTGEERLDQVVATQAAVALDADLGRNGVQVGERALLEFISV